MRGQILRQHGRVSCFTGGTGRISSLCWVTTPGSATAAGSGGRTKASQSPPRRFLWRGARRLGRIRGLIGGPCDGWFHRQRFMTGNGRQGMFGRRRVIGTGQGKASTTSTSAGASSIALFFRAGTGQGMDRFLTGATGFSHRCRITARRSSSLLVFSSVAHQGSQTGGLAVVVVVVIGVLLQVTTTTRTLTTTPQAIGTQSRSSSSGRSRGVGRDGCLFVGGIDSESLCFIIVRVTGHVETALRRRGVQKRLRRCRSVSSLQRLGLAPMGWHLLVGGNLFGSPSHASSNLAIAQDGGLTGIELLGIKLGFQGATIDSIGFRFVKGGPINQHAPSRNGIAAGRRCLGH